MHVSVSLFNYESNMWMYSHHQKSRSIHCSQNKYQDHTSSCKFHSLLLKQCSCQIGVYFSRTFLWIYIYIYTCNYILVCEYTHTHTHKHEQVVFILSINGIISCIVPEFAFSLLNRSWRSFHDAIVKEPLPSLQ